jgi:hypothetical protein
MRLHRPSAPLVISILALVIAASGTAVAAGHYLITSSKQIKPGAIALGNLSRAARKALHGAAGPRGQTGLQGQIGLPGQMGAPGVPGTARAFGWIHNGALDTSLPNRDIASVGHPGPGVVCIHLADGTTPSSTGMLATPDLDGDTTLTGTDVPQAFVEVESQPLTPCRATGGFQITTLERSVQTSAGFVTHIVLQQKDEGFFFIAP